MNIQDAFYHTVHNADGGAEALASRLGMSAAILRNKACPTNKGNTPTIHDADRLMGITGDYAFLDALAANHGRVCVRIEDGAGASDMAVLDFMARCWSTTGDFGQEVNKALADGKITRTEVLAMRGAAMRACQALQQMMVGLEGMAEK